MSSRIPVIHQSITAPTTCADSVLIDDWHVVAWSKELAPGSVIGTRLLGRDLVVWRDNSGHAHVWEDLCIHRGSRLSKGWVTGDALVCPYHGWQYDCSGQCVLIPATPHQPPPLKARGFPYHVAETSGVLWAS